MKESSDPNGLHSQVVFLKMRGKSTEELISIWKENNQKVIGKEEFDAVAKILLERIGKLPDQRAIYKDPYKTPVKKKGWFEAEPTSTASSGLSVFNQIRIAIAVILGLFDVGCGLDVK
jgi:hypothetical protein